MNRFFILFLILTALSSFSFGQKKSEKLKEKEKVLLKNIKNTENLIHQNIKSEQLTISEIGIIQHQIIYREELISNYNYQIRKYDTKIKKTEKQIVSIENNIKILKSEYRKMLVHAFKNRNTDYKFLYIVSAKTFSEAFHRMKYIQHYSDYRQNQIKQIQENLAVLEDKKALDSIQRKNKEILTQTQKKEKERYLSDKRVHQKSLSILKADEQKLKSKLSEQKAKKRKLSIAIRKAIESEIAKTTEKTGKGFSLTPEGVALSKTFISNKGNLPWPVSKGEITGKYGKHKHDVVTTATIENNGIDITTEKQAEVRAVYKGKVSSVLVIPGAGKVVIISHGDYRTVYSNLKDIKVKKGDEIDTKQPLGNLLINENEAMSEAHFEIWKITSNGMLTENPALWLYR